jgi:hypothetical protein
VNPLFPSGPLTAAMLLALTVVLTSCSDQPEPVGDAPGQAEAADSAAVPPSPGTQSVTLEQARAIHDAALVLDAHADIEIAGSPSRYAGEDGVSRVAPEKMRAGGVDAVVMAVAVGPVPRTAREPPKATPRRARRPTRKSRRCGRWRRIQRTVW